MCIRTYATFHCTVRVSNCQQHESKRKKVIFFLSRHSEVTKLVSRQRFCLRKTTLKNSDSAINTYNHMTHVSSPTPIIFMH